MNAEAAVARDHEAGEPAQPVSRCTPKARAGRDRADRTTGPTSSADIARSRRCSTTLASARTRATSPTRRRRRRPPVHHAGRAEPRSLRRIAMSQFGPPDHAGLVASAESDDRGADERAAGGPRRAHGDRRRRRPRVSPAGRRHLRPAWCPARRTNRSSKDGPTRSPAAGRRLRRTGGAARAEPEDSGGRRLPGRARRPPPQGAEPTTCCHGSPTRRRRTAWRTWTWSSTGVLMLVAGHETTVNLISNGTLTMLRRPDLLERLRSEPEISLRFVEELLRFEPPVQYLPTGWPPPTIEIGGVTIPKGVADRPAARRGEPRPGSLRQPGPVRSRTAPTTSTSASAVASTTASVPRWRVWKGSSH